MTRVSPSAPGPDDRSQPVGLVHDYLLVMRGAERTFAAIAELWSAAPVYTLLFDGQATSSSFAGREVRASYLRHLRPVQRNFRRLLPLYPGAAERLPVARHRLVVSSSSAFAHGVRPAPEAIHVCYCHTPFRYVWYERSRALAESPRRVRPLVERQLERIRRWDLAASKRVTHYVANSQFTRRRIQDCYDRDAAVVPPPVDVGRFDPAEPEDYFLVVGEIVRHKRVEVALEAARRAGRRIKVVGDGPEAPRLRALYGTSAEFLGRVSDERLASLYSRATALIAPSVEEFGIAVVEAQAAGRPAVASDAGGARDTVVPGTTGVRVPVDDVDALAEALRYTDFDAYDERTLVRHAAQFAPESFRARLAAEVAQAGQPTGETLAPPADARL